MKWKNMFKSLHGRRLELMSLVGILLIAGIFTLFRPIDGETLSYFSDFTTPMVIIVGILIIILGLKTTQIRKVQNI